MSIKFKVMIDVIRRYLPRIDSLSDNPRVVLIRHHYAFALCWNGKYREAAAVQRETLPIAERLGDARSKAYVLAAEMFISTVVAPKSLNELGILKREATTAASSTHRRLH